MKKTLAIILTFFLCFGVLSVAFANKNKALTTEIPDGYIAIYTAEDLNNIRNNLSGKFILMNDIDLSEYENWEPIGAPDFFTGIFDGNGYSVAGINIKEACNEIKGYFLGLFYRISDATVKNLTIKNSNIDAKSTGNEKSNNSIGLLCGYAKNSTVINCNISGNIAAENFNSNYIGGITGSLKNSVLEFCTSKASIKAHITEKTTNVSVGGLVGINASVIEKCASYSNINITSKNIKKSCEYYIGGIVGYSEPPISPLFGTYNGIYKIINCHANGNITVDYTPDYSYIGGIAGVCWHTENVYSAVEFDLPENYAGVIGAVVGDSEAASANLTTVDGKLYEGIEPSTLVNSYFLDSDIKNATGYSIDDFGFTKNIKILSAEKMKYQQSFAGFDFENVWKMKELQYPILQFELKKYEQTTNPIESTTQTITEPYIEVTTTHRTTELTESTTKHIESTLFTEESSQINNEKPSEPNNLNGINECLLLNLLKNIYGFIVSLWFCFVNFIRIIIK